MIHTKWQTFITTTSLSEPQIELFGTLIIQLLFFWVPGILLLLLHQYLSAAASIIQSPQHPSDEQSKTHWIFQLIPFRLQVIPHTSRRTISSKSLHNQQYLQSQPSIPDLFTRVLLNQLYLFLTHTLLLILFPTPFTISASLPSISKLAVDLAVALPIADYLFYIVHRTLHTYPRLYRSIHRIHHRWKHPVSLAAQYAHPVEFLIGNCWVVWVPLAGVGWVGKTGVLKGITPSWRWANEGVHIVEWWILWAGVLLETVIVHGGVEAIWRWQVGGRGKLGASNRKRGVIRRHDLHHEVGAGGGRKITGGGGSEKSLWKGRRKRWGNFGTFWWMDWLHDTEIVPLDIDSDLDSSGDTGEVEGEADSTVREQLRLGRNQTVNVFPTSQEKHDNPGFHMRMNQPDDETRSNDSGVEFLDYIEEYRFSNK